MIQIRNEKYHCRYNNNNNFFTSSCLIRNYNNQNIENKIRVLAARNNHGVWLSQPGQQNTVAQMRTQKKEREEKNAILPYNLGNYRTLTNSINFEREVFINN